MGEHQWGDRFSDLVAPVPKEERRKTREADANDSSSVWQVVFRNRVPVDEERAGPWLPVPDDYGSTGRGIPEELRSPKGVREPLKILPTSEFEALPVKSGVRRVPAPLDRPPEAWESCNARAPTLTSEPLFLGRSSRSRNPPSLKRPGKSAPIA